MNDLQGSGHALDAVAVEALAECTHEPLQRKVGGTAGQGVVAEVDEPVRLEVKVDEGPEIGTNLCVHPRIHPMHHDIIKSWQFEIGDRAEINRMKCGVGDFSLSCQAPGVIDVGRHHVDAIKLAGGMHRRQHDCRHALAAAQIAPGKTALPCRWRHARENGDMVQPSGRQLRYEHAHIRNIQRAIVGSGRCCCHKVLAIKTRFCQEFSLAQW